MSDRFPILRSLDPYHARIGYLGALASVAVRGIDTQDALAARLHELLFDRVYKDDPRLPELLGRIPAERQEELRKRYSRPEEEDPAALFTEPASAAFEPPPADWLLGRSGKKPRPRSVTTDWLYVSELWLYDGAMPSPVGLLPREKVDRTIDLARWTGVLLPTFELSETGYLLQHLLATSQQASPRPDLFNPLNAKAHPSLPLLYFRILLSHELLFAFLVVELIHRKRVGQVLATRGVDGLLLAATNRLLSCIGEITDPEEVLAARDVDRFRSAIQPEPADAAGPGTPRKGSNSTQENYLRPRIEMLVDLGFLARRWGQDASRFVWEPTRATEELASVLERFTSSSQQSVASVLESFLDRAYFGAMARVLAPGNVPVSGDDERLLWFARAFDAIGREFGFTPGRTLALKACMLAWEAGRTMEVGHVFDAVYHAAGQGSRFERFLHFSGGSRFDREFLIRIDPGLVKALGAGATA